MNLSVEPQSASARRLKKRHITLALTIAVLLGIFVPPFITLNRYKSRLAGVIGSALGGRRATVGDITLRLLPRPGFDLTGLEVSDDPRFSAEPMLRAASVTAYVSLSSIWRGRLELARLNLSSPSLNLVRNAEGHWNLESVLEHAQAVPSAPTGNRVEGRIRFPYIEAEDARINFKFVQEKSVFALTEADLSLWQSSESDWQMRLAARPMRTDATLTDTGTIKVDGGFRRVAAGQPTPYRLVAEWQNGQLGQLTALISGQDRGWRASIDADLSVESDGNFQKFAAQFRVSDFRRYNVPTLDSLNGTIGCQGQRTSSAPAAGVAVSCDLPVGSGRLLANANLITPAGWPTEMQLTAESVPASWLAALYRHIKRNVPAALNADGTLDGRFTRGADGGWSAHGALNRASIRSAALTPALEIGDVRFDTAAPPPAKSLSRRAQLRPQAPAAPVMAFSLAPIQLNDAGSPPSKALVRGALTNDGYSFEVHGQAGVKRALALADSLGLETPDAEFSGNLEGSVLLQSVWRGFAPAVPSGKLSLSRFTVDRSGVIFPLKAEFATLEFKPTGATLWSQDAALGSTGLHVRGALMFPRCAADNECPYEFDLHADSLHADQLTRAFGQPKKTSWLSFGRQKHVDNPLAGIKAVGKISIGEFKIKNLSAERLSGTATFDSGNLSVPNLQASIFGGGFQGAFASDLTGVVPKYTLDGELKQAVLESIGGAFWPDDWAASPARAGSISGKLQLSMSGASAAELYTSTQGTLDLDWKGGTLTTQSQELPNSLRVAQTKARITILDSALRVSAGKLQSSSGIYAVTGTISFARDFDLSLERSGQPTLTVKRLAKTEQVAQRSSRSQ